MLHTIRQRLVSHRILLVAMLLLCVVAKPVIVLACEVHESQHALQTGHGHDDVEHLQAQPVDEPQPADDGKLWHALLHQGHCCVHGAALVTTPDVSLAPITAHVPECGVVPALRTRGLEPTLRPPIRI